MSKPHNDSPEQILPGLLERLATVGLRPQMIKIIKGKLALNIKREWLKLPPIARHQAYKAVQSKYRRPTLDLVRKIVEHLRDALELETKEDEARRGWRGPTGGPKGTWTKYAPELQPPEGPQDGPETAEQFLAYYEDFLSKNLGRLQFSDELKRTLAQRAEDVRKELMDQYGLTAPEVASLTTVSFYDIFFLCDNSGSMRFGNRMDAMVETLQRVCFWATMIEPSGISLRFLTHRDDDKGQFDNLTDTEKIDDLLAGVKLGGPTELGTMLRRKVILPLEERAQTHGGRIKPRIVIIITDGEPTREYKDRLRDVMYEIKTAPNGLATTFGSAVTVFLVARVGNDDKASIFLRDLRKDPKLCSMVYVFDQPLDDVLETLVQHAGKKAYETLV
ncbi:hypothetical protein BJX63DRAFT_431013 [Aspergillus granulosus]|uniref:VWFA domain-containing protein n=1 Tax=Aspergillus granulosus TaxID=176169 RepID=A0ABR4HI77_9EURO